MSSKSQNPQGLLAQVYQAQMNVGDANKHPEFAGNVVSIECGNYPPDVKGVPLGGHAKATSSSANWARTLLRLLGCPRCGRTGCQSSDPTELMKHSHQRRVARPTLTAVSQGPTRTMNCPLREAGLQPSWRLR